VSDNPEIHLTTRLLTLPWRHRDRHSVPKHTEQPIAVREKQEVLFLIAYADGTCPIV